LTPCPMMMMMMHDARCTVHDARCVHGREIVV
jgi:hypothetical protein